MANERSRLKLGKRASFVKTHLKQLPQDKETWEADFRALPRGGRRAVGSRSAGERKLGSWPVRSTTAAWFSRMTGAIRLQRQWLFWRRGWQGGAGTTKLPCVHPRPRSKRDSGGSVTMPE